MFLWWGNLPGKEEDKSKREGRCEVVERRGEVIYNEKHEGIQRDREGNIVFLGIHMSVGIKWSEEKISWK